MGSVAEIADTLARIEELLGGIEPLRREVAATIAEMDQAHREYEEAVGPAARESIRLETAIARMRSLFQPAVVHHAAERVGEPGPSDPVTPPRGWEASPGRTTEPEIHALRKRSIADHVLYFAASENDPVVLLMNSMLARPEQQAGEMLELIAWGDIWKASPDWESEAECLDRLKSWQRELESRLEYWAGRNRLLTGDSRHAITVARQRLTRTDWQDYLSEIVREHEAENSKLTNELNVLEAEYVRRQRGTVLEP